MTLSKKPIAQVDMDGTLCDFDAEMVKRLNEIRCPAEAEVGYDYRSFEEANPWFKARIKMIMDDDSFWDSLKEFKLGFDVLAVLDELGFDSRILTKGPKKNLRAWTRKATWCYNHIPERSVTITRDKGQVYGRVLVDDFPEYVLSWLEWRPRGLVIMPASGANKDFKHPKVIRYDGSNLDEVRRALANAALRKSGEE